MMTLLKNLFAKFKNDDRGIISAEMVVMMPVMFAWIIGSNAFFDAFKTYLRANKATYTAVDLVSRQTVVNDNYIAIVGSVFDSIVDIDDATPSVVISSIEMTNDALAIGWSVGTNGTDALSSLDEIPDSFIPTLVNGETVIVIQSYVPFTPVYSWANLTSKTFTNTVAVTPRFGSKISNTSQP